LRAPVAAPRVTSPFNFRRMHPVLHRVMPHLGCDFGAPMGEPVYAAAEGTVLSAGDGGPSGNLVRISHPALGIETGYAHLSRFAPGMRAGQHVHARQLVGYVGSTGRSTGPHLHFSVKRGTQFVDPLQYYGGRRAVPAPLRAEFDQRAPQLAAALDAIRIAGEPETVPSEPSSPPPEGATSTAPPETAATATETE
jgi:murein DD-endopeptidase MepM/ murein hydrolase activator NlpD